MEFLLLRFVLLLLAPLSWNGSRRVGRLLGSFAAGALRLRWKVTLDNLRHAFPERSEVERSAIARAAYREIGTTFLEMFRSLRPGEASTRCDSFAAELLRDALDEGRGAILLTGHFGNWELLGAAVADGGWPLHAVVATQKNRWIDALVTRRREAVGLKILRSDAGLRPILRALKSNQIVCFLADQDAGRTGHFVPFLGRPASSPGGPARFARLARCPILVGFSVRSPGGRYRFEFGNLIRIREDLPSEEAEKQATAEIAALLEERIRRYPEQWFWMHRRWKTRPPGETTGPGPSEGP
ncbi:MAG: lysophospholipid acyltransferase family protein [Candidatus Eisenbacteria bacterium]|nr:lysophospholipid acyltransferase family protein [Candidatus Eisenbacteria bacterium]MCC7143911.1 lysophospholipid acyltransferase family protein [Candidatus Eisenbacteria bacterium]